MDPVAYEDRCWDLAWHRASGATLQAIALLHDVEIPIIRSACRKYVRDGLMTRAQLGMKPMKRRVPRTSDAEYVAGFIARVRAKCIADQNGCWLWQGWLTWKGYGETTYRSKNMSVHRAMFTAVHGMALTPKDVICHRCDVRNCCNPDHLFLGTFAINNADMARKGRCKYSKERWTHCKKGHAFTDENTYHCKEGFRHCRACDKLKVERDRLKRTAPSETEFQQGESK